MNAAPPLVPPNKWANRVPANVPETEPMNADAEAVVSELLKQTKDTVQSRVNDLLARTHEKAKRGELPTEPFQLHSGVKIQNLNPWFCWAVAAFKRSNESLKQTEKRDGAYRWERERREGYLREMQIVAEYCENYDKPDVIHETNQSDKEKQ